MARFLRVEIVTGEDTSIFLSKDGSETAVRCKLEIPEYENLLSPTTGVLIRAASGAFVEQLVPDTHKQFEIKILTWLGVPVWDQIKALRNTNFGVIITENKSGVWTETFNRTVRTFPEGAFTAQNPDNGKVHAASLRLYTV